MGILLWIVFGALVGWVASMVMKREGNILGNVILGVIGAVVGGFLMDLLGFSGVTGFNIYSLLVAILGAIIVVWIARSVT